MRFSAVTILFAGVTTTLLLNAGAAREKRSGFGSGSSGIAVIRPGGGWNVPQRPVQRPSSRPGDVVTPNKPTVQPPPPPPPPVKPTPSTDQDKDKNKNAISKKKLKKEIDELKATCCSGKGGGKLMADGSGGRCEVGLVEFKDALLTQAPDEMGRRFVTRSVNFASKFSSRPDIVTSINALDVHWQANVRIMLNATDISKKGFDLVARDWSNSRTHFLTVSWIACEG